MAIALVKDNSLEAEFEVELPGGSSGRHLTLLIQKRKSELYNF